MWNSDYLGKKKTNQIVNVFSKKEKFSFKFQKKEKKKEI